MAEIQEEAIKTLTERGFKVIVRDGVTTVSW